MTKIRPVGPGRAASLSTSFILYGGSKMQKSNAEMFQLTDGRDLAFQFWGDPNGAPLYFFHGFPGSRLQASLVHQEALAAGVCLVATDRPGMGRSTADVERRILDWPSDVEQLADHLGHRRFGVLGVSCGGPYALACALRLGDRLDYIGLLAGIGPMNVPAIRKDQLPMLKVMFALARSVPWMLSPMLLLDRFMLRTAPERAVRSLAGLLAEPDRLLLAERPDLVLNFAEGLAEAYRQGIAGPMHEARLIGRDHGFDVSEVRQQVHCYQAGRDRHVPPAMSQYLAERLPRCTWRRYLEEGHLSIVKNRFSDCLADFLHASEGMQIPAS